MAYDVDLYTYNGTIIHNECQTKEEMFKLISSSIDEVQLINIQKDG